MHYRSDQEFRNWDASIGMTGWWFVNCDPLRSFGDFLRLSNDPDDYAPGVIRVAFPGSRDGHDKMTDLLTQEQLDAAAWASFDRWIESFGN